MNQRRYIMNDCVDQFKENEETGLLDVMDEAIIQGDAQAYVKATFKAVVDEKKVANMMDVKATRLTGIGVID